MQRHNRVYRSVEIQTFNLFLVNKSCGQPRFFWNCECSMKQAIYSKQKGTTSVV